jgi:hypothetical protein
LENQPNSIENALREKFESFAPPPPEHIWEGVAAGIGAQTKPLIAANVWKGIAIAASVLLLLGFVFWWFLPDNDADVIQQTEEILTIEEINQENENVTGELAESEIIENTESLVKPVETELIVEENEATVKEETSAGKNIAQSPAVPEEREKSQQATPGLLDPLETQTIEIQSDKPGLYAIASYETDIDNELPLFGEEQTLSPPTLITGADAQMKPSGWTHGFYLTAEVMLNDFDSVSILPVYSFNYEPTYHFTNHFFMRFGAGLQYARDRGFAKIDYISNEVVGTYEDVYDVTFDSIDGVLVPTYHTNTTEVWDSVRRYHVSEVTNTYLYFQVPVLFGYHKRSPKFNWFFYGGPAINLMVSKWVEEPVDDLEGADIIDLQNNLPERSPYYLQMWVGAGIEYKFSKNLALAVEPNYRYYFNQVYKDDPYKKGLSSFGLRVGIVYMVK